MGRRKITIRQIVDPKLRHITFNKRKNGLIKKAAELSLLCNVNMLLIFEDGNGNLIQFSKNKLVNIPSFFQECRYSNVLEFNAKDYPNFFKVNHYKKHKERDQDDYDNDDLEITGEMNPRASQSGSQSKLLSKRDRIHGPGHIKEEDRDSSKIIYQSGSDESSNEGNDDVSSYSERPSKEAILAQKKKSQMKPKQRLLKPEEKQKPNNEEETIVPPVVEQEAPSNQKEAFQAYKEVPQRLRGEKPIDYSAQFMGFEHPFKRNTPAGDPGNSPFRFYPADNANLNAPNPAANAYVNNPNYVNSHPYIHNNHGYPGAPTGYPNNKPTNRLREFGNINMGNMPNEEALNAMFKGFPPLGFAIGGGNPFMAKPNTKPEMDEKLLNTANMIKYLNGTGANYAGQKIYNFHPAETGKSEDADPMAHLRNRNDHEGGQYDHEHEYHELPPYVRGDFRIDGNLPSNLPSAYFSSKKFNFDGYFNTFEDDRFNEFGDPKKKLKQG